MNIFFQCLRAKLIFKRASSIAAKVTRVYEQQGHDVLTSLLYIICFYILSLTLNLGFDFFTYYAQVTYLVYRIYFNKKC